MNVLPLENALQEKYPLYSQGQALCEAQRCLYCYDPPCVKACPTQIDIPVFIRKIATKNVRGAAATILRANILGYSCAKVCPVEMLCVGACVYHERGEAPIEIGRLQRFATSAALETLEPEQLLGRRKASSGKKIALIGAGPASLAAGAMLAMEGHQAVLFDKRSFAGGLNATGIAPYKLKHKDALAEIDWLRGLGLEFRLGQEISHQAKSLEIEFDAIFLGLGLGEDRIFNVPGARGPGVYGACALIEKIKTDANFSLKNIQRAHVIGGGNTAIDIAHELRLLQVPYVAMHYRANKDLMSGYRHELDAALKDGVHLWPNSSVEHIVHDNIGLLGFYTQDCDQMIKSDLIVLAIGQSGVSNAATNFSHLTFDERGCILVDPKTHRTKNPKIWSAGDCVNGGKEVVHAVAEAKIAVASMLKYLEGA